MSLSNLRSPSAAPRHIVVANPHHLGDALMMFPLAGALRRRWPQAAISFAGLPYVEPLVRACEFFDDFIDSRDIVADPSLLKRRQVDVFLNPFPDDELAYAAWAAGTPVRIGNLLRRSARYCNRFVAYNSTLKGHVLDFYGRHLRPLGIDGVDTRAEPRELHGLTRVQRLGPRWAPLLGPDRINLIVHPKTGGQAREWPLASWLSLVRALADHGTFRLFVTGTAAERELVHAECPDLLSGRHVYDMMGRLELDEFLALVNAADGLLGCSTGPLHIAAALDRHALGIYPAGRGIDPVCWAPVGRRVHILRADGNCHPGRGACPRAKGPPCSCTSALTPDRVLWELVVPALCAQPRAVFRRHLGDEPAPLAPALARS